MKTYNKDKTLQLTNPDLGLGRLVADTMHIRIDEVQAVPPIGHYEVIAEYENGGKDVKFIEDVAGVEYQPSQEYDEDILVYIPYTDTELAENKLTELRERRRTECFSVCDRACWYDALTQEQKAEVQAWRRAWLDVTDTLIIPDMPDWIY